MRISPEQPFSSKLELNSATIFSNRWKWMPLEMELRYLLSWVKFSILRLGRYVLPHLPITTWSERISMPMEDQRRCISRSRKSQIIIGDNSWISFARLYSTVERHCHFIPTPLCCKPYDADYQGVGAVLQKHANGDTFRSNSSFYPRLPFYHCAHESHPSS